MYHSRLNQLIAARGRLCVGIDPQPSVLAVWGLPNTAAGVERCARSVVEALGDQVAVFKPQSAFFEAHGSKGVAVLEAVLDDVGQAGALSLLDVKRGDIGSTMAGYAAAYLDADAPLGADAITLNPYLGFESLRPALDLAKANGKGVYVLARTSNPEGGATQLALASSGRTVAQEIVDAATAANFELDQAIGLVVGGTHEGLGVDLSDFNGSILVPGIGAQGGRIDQLWTRFGSAAVNVLPAASREVLLAGPEKSRLRQKVTELGVFDANS